MSRKQIALAILALSVGGFAIGVTEFAIMGLQREAVADLFGELNETTMAQGGMLVTFYALGVVVGAPVLALLGAKRERKTWALFLLALFAGAMSSASSRPPSRRCCWHVSSPACRMAPTSRRRL